MKKKGLGPEVQKWAKVGNPNANYPSANDGPNINDGFGNSETQTTLGGFFGLQSW